MKKLFAILLILALALCGATACAEAGEAAIECAIEDGSYVIRIPDPSGDLGWVADDMAQDDSVVKLDGAELVDGAFVVRYAPVGDGDVSVHVRHYTGIACDQLYGWDLKVQDGAVLESTGGFYTASPNTAEQDEFLAGEWLEDGTQFAQMTVAMNESGRGWDVEVVSPMTHGAYVFKTTIYYDCELDAFVYDKGKFWEVPVTDSEGDVELGEAAVAGTCGSFTLEADGQDLLLTWYDDQSPEGAVLFRRFDEEVEQAEAYGEALHASIQHVVDSPEWVTALPEAQDEAVKQLYVVAGIGMDKSTATVSMHGRAEDGSWKQLLSTPGFVGKNGLCLDADHAEGCAQTPLGVYHFNKAFGIAADPGCAIPYIQVDDDIYWSGDPDYHYNEMMNINDYPGLAMDDSEHIVDYEYEYQYCLNISFNEDGTPGRGSAIFLHCLGPTKPWTGGCVAIPENIMKLVMQNVREDCVVVIDMLDNLGGSL